jgi:hypothetical protein
MDNNLEIIFYLWDYWIENNTLYVIYEIKNTNVIHLTWKKIKS